VLLIAFIMFSNHWIVADMDGTLTPTPSRAHGKYFSLSYCMATGLGYGARYHSCLPWLRLFVERGGSICVISTAGKRMWTQLYNDLAPAVFALSSTTRPRGSSAAAKLAGGPTSLVTASPTPGTLYLCGFTGAAMFRTRPCDAVWADMDRLHPGWRGQSSTDAASTSPASLPNWSDFVVPPASVGMEEWAAYRQQAVASHSSPSSSTTLDAAAYAVATEEGRRAIIRFFEHASYVSGHNVATAAAFFAECLSTKYHSVFATILQQLLDEVAPTLQSAADKEEGGKAVSHLCFADSQVLSPQALASHGFFLKETNDALVDAQQVPHADGTIAAGAPVAQVVVMGIPMRYCDHIFPSSPSSATKEGSADSPVDTAAGARWQCCPRCAAAGAGARARIEAAGLQLKPQPNSVCLHRRDVDKGTCVRWLCSQKAAKTVYGATRGLPIDLAKAVAFGDVPESVDRPLTEYPPMQFVSLSTKDDASTQLAALQAEVAPGAASPYLYHVGGEEEGTALFLEELLTDCIKEADETLESGTCDGRTWFTPARVLACAARAHATMKTTQAERCQSEGMAKPSYSTL
jgi:hypothetical protein